MLDISTGIISGKKKILLKSYENCFDGISASQWIQKEFHVDEDKSVQIGQTVFMNRDVFYSIRKHHISFHATADMLYRFRIFDLESNRPINMINKYSDRVKDEAWKVASSLAVEMLRLLKKSKTEKGINLNSVKNTSDYIRFALRTSKLQKVNLAKLSKDKRLLFWLNIYNVLLLHSYIMFGKPADTLEKKNIWSKSYKIEENEYSLESIFLILRGKTAELNEDLKNLEGVKLQPTLMIHFCCFNGSDQSPFFKPFSSLDSLIFDMTEASSAFLDRTCKINDHDEIFVPKMFKDYPEFGGKKEILETLSKFIQSKSIQNLIKNYKETAEIKYLENSYNNIQFMA